MKKESKKITLESSLKALEIENFLDKYFYRPIGFIIAKQLSHTSITPNMVTILSIFVGVAGGTCFYFDTYRFIFGGIALLILANILDCVDGQLARITGIKSKTGRILDGFAGDLWFAAIYLSIATQLVEKGWSQWIYAMAIISGLSHAMQASSADYFKNFHLYVLKGKSGAELDSSNDLKQKYQSIRWKNDFIEKLFLYFYCQYTKRQEKLSPKIQPTIQTINKRYIEIIPLSLQNDFRKKSKKAIQGMHALAFNGRTPFLFIFLLIKLPWLYYCFEIIILNIVLFISLKAYQKVCIYTSNSIDKNTYEE